jgi:predicted  nucleic acid-binding Zn-ribbon protein
MSNPPSGARGQQTPGSTGADLYNDLDDIALSADYAALQSKYEESEKARASLTTEIEELKQQIVALVEEKSILEKNTVALYNTALRELERKDREIAELKSK